MIGILGAMDIELEALLSDMEDKKEEKDEKNRVTPRIEIEVVDNSDLEAVMYRDREK